jgi:SnoaL-like domain
VELREIVDAYDRAWREPDTGERRRLLERSLTDDAELVSPQGRWTGREAVAEWIDGFGERMPGAQVKVTSDVDAHHGFARFAWTITGEHASTILEGVDVCELGDDGRLRRVVMFFGPIPRGSG